ncbi:hypothetical protein PG996_003071 [Apiospora saccharicola]|uniref:Uncharacterized protein n=1 Tax=Apiospora saccharicola TaxID=335842 RepID=A0ABR1W075_9PEZI
MILSSTKGAHDSFSSVRLPSHVSNVPLPGADGGGPRSTLAGEVFPGEATHGSPTDVSKVVVLAACWAWSNLTSHAPLEGGMLYDATWVLKVPYRRPWLN